MWIEKIQNKTPEQKRKIITIILIICVLALVILWVLTTKLKNHLPKDTSLFQTISTGINNAKDKIDK